MVTASETAGMPFAIMVNLEDFTVRTITAPGSSPVNSLCLTVERVCVCVTCRAPSCWLQSQRTSRSSGWRCCRSRGKCE